MSLMAWCRARFTIDLPTRSAMCSSSFGTRGYGTTKRNPAKTTQARRLIILCRKRFPPAEACLSLTSPRLRHPRWRAATSKPRFPLLGSLKLYPKQGNPLQTRHLPDLHLSQLRQSALRLCNMDEFIASFPECEIGAMPPLQRNECELGPSSECVVN